MSALLYLVANLLYVSPMLHKFLIILCYGYWYSFCLRLNSKLLLLISGFQQQIKPDIASPATLSFIGAWQQRGKNLMNVKDLLNTIVLSAPVTGLRSGTSRGKTGRSQVLFKLASALGWLFFWMKSSYCSVYLLPDHVFSFKPENQ